MTFEGSSWSGGVAGGGSGHVGSGTRVSVSGSSVTFTAGGDVVGYAYQSPQAAQAELLRLAGEYGAIQLRAAPALLYTAPTLASVSPASVAEGVTTLFTLVGTGLSQGGGVQFGSLPWLSDYSVKDDGTELYVYVTGATGGTSGTPVTYRGPGGVVVELP